VVDDLNEVSDCLQHVLALNPGNQVARQKYEALLHRHPNLAALDPAKAGDYEKAKAAAKAAKKAAAKAEKAGAAKKKA
jgi:phage baseplate assembly protein W